MTACMARPRFIKRRLIGISPTAILCLRRSNRCVVCYRPVGARNHGGIVLNRRVSHAFLATLRTIANGDQGPPRNSHENRRPFPPDRRDLLRCAARAARRDHQDQPGPLQLPAQGRQDLAAVPPGDVRPRPPDPRDGPQRHRHLDPVDEHAERLCVRAEDPHRPGAPRSTIRSSRAPSAIPIACAASRRCPCPTSRPRWSNSSASRTRPAWSASASARTSTASRSTTAGSSRSGRASPSSACRSPSIRCCRPSPSTCRITRCRSASASRSTPRSASPA